MSEKEETFDPWSSCHNSITNNSNTNSFEDSFQGTINHNNEMKQTENKLIVSDENYAKKLEAKLSRIQNRSKQHTGKVMLKNLEAMKNLQINELLSRDTEHFVNSDHLIIDTENSEKLINKLYNTNSLYRHLNPQQGLDLNEKQPLVKYDILQLESSDEKKDDV